MEIRKTDLLLPGFDKLRDIQTAQLAKGMTQIVHNAGLSRESLYRSLSGDHGRSFDTVLKVINALGLRLHAEATRIPKVGPQQPGVPGLS